MTLDNRSAVDGPAPDGAAERRQRLAEALRARRTAPAPLAPNQERLFVLQQLDPQSTAYAETVVLRLRGELRTDLLVSALRALPTRHEWLRSRIEVGRDGPVQVVDDQLPAVILEAELAPSGAGPQSADELAPEAEAWVRSLAEDPLLLEDGPPWRAGLARIAADDHLLVLVVHHVACDATSLAVLIDELGERYDAALLGTPIELHRTPSPRDLARTIRARQSSSAAHEAVAAHAAALTAADLDARVAGAPGAAESPGAAEVHVRQVPSDVAARASRVATELGVTPFAVVGVAIGQALADAMDVHTPVIGVPVDLRWHLDGSDEVVSFLVETVALPLPDVVRRPLTVGATAVRDAVASALAEPPPFEEVVTALRQAGTLPPTGTPLHAYVTWLEGEEHPTLGTSGPAVTHVDLPLGPAKFDLSWTVVSSGGELDLRLEYDSARMGAQAARALVAAVVRMLDVATADPGTPVADAELLNDAELAQIRKWEGTATETPADDLMTHVERGLADGPVLVSQEETIEGPELRTRIGLLAATLQSRGVRPGDRVAVPSRRVPAMVVSLLAVLRAGATFVPIDVSHPMARQAALVRAAGVTAVVGARTWGEPLAEAAGATAVVVDSGGRPKSPSPTGPASPHRAADDLAYVMFTSGSTGTPKAVRVPDSAVVARIESYRELLASSGVRHLVQSTLTFDASIYMFWALATGGCLVLPEDEEAADPLALAGLVAAHEVTDAFFVPGLYEALLRVAPPGSMGSLRRLCIGGDVVPPQLAALHHATLPQAAFLNVYGPTEAVVTSTATPILSEDLVDGSALPIGRPHRGTMARVLDRYGRRVPIGAVGELHLGGPCIADGYDRQDPDPGQSSPFSVREDQDGRASRWYATGDLARWRDDGRLDYLGRRDRQVKLRGQRVELGEIEATVRRLPGVREAAVELLGSGDGRRLAVFVAPELHGVRESLAAVLPPAWVPDVVITLPDLPRLPSGKLDRGVLRNHSSTPDTDTPAGRASKEHGRQTGLERTVLSIVRALLEDDGIGLDDDFFAVGGNSLLAARLMGQLSAMLGVAAPLHELLADSTVRGIAALADRDFSRGTAASREEARLVPVREQGSLPPAVLIARDGATSLVLKHFLSRMDTERPLWVILRPMPALGYQVPNLVTDGAAVAQLLLDHFSDGPIHLLGHSASGIVTVETARTLGDRRGVTILLDTVPPSAWSSTPLRNLANLARRALERGRLRKEGIRRPAGNNVPPSPRTARAFRLYQDSLASSEARMRPVDFPLTVLTSEATRTALGRSDLGWGQWATRLETVPLAGDHLSLLLQPEVAETARVIDEVLGRWR